MQQQYGRKMEEEIEKEVCKIDEGVEISHWLQTASTTSWQDRPDSIGILENVEFLHEFEAPYSLFVCINVI